MAIFKCKMCGGDLNVQAGVSVVECDYCGTKQTVPAADDEKKLTLFNRANRLRLNNEFDKASGVYEAIVADFPEEAEAYWGLLLCNYGVEYVDDPATGKKVPTCHRSSFDSILDDQNLEMACEYADAYARRQYRDEAKQLEEIRKGIIEVSSKEEPYDIFICYKETDENGDRTLDSVLAQDVYDALTEKGYRVFFSRITLEDKLGTEYEPYIFAALNSAKVMLAFGTDYEYYNAVWVKNEWSRFLRLMSSGQKKTLIPCYKGIDAYDMPKEFAKLQAQDMGKVGAMQDLIRGIDKIFDRDKKTVVAVPVASDAPTVAPLLERAFMFLEDGEWKKADDLLEQVLNQDPKNAQAYLGKLMAELKVRKPADLKNCDQPFDHSDNYQKVLRFGDEKLTAFLMNCVQYIRERNEGVRKKAIYDEALILLRNATETEECEEAARKFCQISGFMDSDEKAERCNRRIAELKKEQEHQIMLEKMHAQERTKKKKKISKILAVYSVALVAVICFCFLLALKIVPGIQHTAELSKKYKAAISLMESDKYAEAIKAFSELDGYKKSEQKIEECTAVQKEEAYATAIKLFNEGNALEAYPKLAWLGDYKDSAEKAKEIFEEYEIQKIKTANVGDVVVFGNYEQDNDISNGKEKIEWRVLAKENKRLLLVSKYALDCQPYNTSDSNVTWETCSLRKWLNETFLKNAFTDEEQMKIATTVASADANPRCNTSQGKATKEKVFLFSTVEADKYVEAGKYAGVHFDSNSYSKCSPTEYATANGVYTSDSNSRCFWWTRTSGAEQSRAAGISATGSVNYTGRSVDYYGAGVRPAMWIDLSK